MNQLVSTQWLNKNLDKVKILDASWHLPNVERNALEEYRSNHIINSIFFDTMSFKFCRDIFTRFINGM